MMLAFLRFEYEKVNISLPNEAQKTPEHLARHPLGKVPALEDGDVTVWDSQAIFVYLARKYDSGGTWFPTDPVGTGARHAMAVFRGEGNVGKAGNGAGHPKNRPGELWQRKIWREAIQIVEDRLDGRIGLAAARQSPISLSIPMSAWFGKVRSRSILSECDCLYAADRGATELCWHGWSGVKPKRLTPHHGKMIPGVWRSPERIRLTCRMSFL